MTDQQLKAKASLERALKGVYESGLKVYGMDHALYLDPRGHDGPGADLDQDQIVRVNDHGCYIDSRGW